MNEHSGTGLGSRLDEVHYEPVDNSRVKVYRLNKEGLWDDKGTGLITLQHLEQSAAMGMVVMGETPPYKPLLIHRLSQEPIYAQQGGQDETIISWTDSEAGTDIAISFQESAGCRQMWTQIQVEQARTRSQLSERGMRRPMIDEMDPSAGPREAMRDAVTAGPVELPAPELKNVESIGKMLVDLTNFQKEQVAHQMLSSKYVRRILDIFRSCEDLEDTESLRHLFEIIKGTIMLNDTGILEVLFAEDNVMDTIGALEYDPELLTQQKHREFLRDVVVFKEVVPLRSAALKAKIHQTYRMGYVKDVILPRALDDGTFATLSSLMMFNNIEVVLALMDEADFFGDMFQKFRAAQPGSEAWSDIIAFLQELATLAKTLQQMHRSALLSKLTQLGLLEALTGVLVYGSQEMQLKATDVLICVVQHEPAPVREFLLRQQDSTLFRSIVQMLTEGAGGGLQEQATEILRDLLDPVSMLNNPEQNEFLDLFYADYIGQLINVVEAGGDKSLKPGEGPSPGALGLIVEILCICATSHGHRIKHFVLKNDIMSKVLKLLHRKERWLVIAAIRFIRACLGLKEIFWMRDMIQRNVFEPIITVFVANGERYNLLNSVILEMFDFIRRENLKMLISHFMERHYSRVDDVDYDPTFAKLKDRYEQSQGGRVTAGPGGPQLQENRRRKDERALDREEEEFFGEGNDDDEPGPQTAPPQHSNGIITSLQMTFPPRLVDYEDDEEDPNHTAPGQKRIGPAEGNDAQAEKRARFMEQHSDGPHRFQVSSPPLLKPGNQIFTSSYQGR